MIRRYFSHITMVMGLILSGCSSSDNNKSEDKSSTTINEYTEMLSRVQQLEQIADKCQNSEISQEELELIISEKDNLYYDYNPMGLTENEVSACLELKNRVISLKKELQRLSNASLANSRVKIFSHDDKLMESANTFPVYLEKGELLRYNISAPKPLNIKIYNSDSHSIVTSRIGKTNVADSLEIKNSAIYLVEINPRVTQYVSIDINYRANNLSRMTLTEIKTDTVSCNREDFRAVKISGINLSKAFEEPRKFTLRGQLKAMFSGSHIALVPVTLPAGATDILYSMRIATSEKDRSNDGEFHDNLTRSYKRIRFLGLPIYEKSSSNGLLNTLLDDNRPIRDEDAYCNMYVFRNQSQAKQFQDGTKLASKLNYDVDYSTLGTQSCNGRIPVKGLRKIYLAFENERMRYTNYLWVEVDIVVPATEYYMVKYHKNN